MGSLTQWNLPPEFVARFPVFIETGVGNGTSLAYAALHGFRSLYSLELNRGNASRATARFEHDDRIAVLHGKSIDLLHELLTSHLSVDPIFFFLDAHFASGDILDDPEGLGADVEAWVPLHEELRRIRNLRPDGNYAILIDDMKIFCDIEVVDKLPPGSWVKRNIPQGIGFLEPFRSSHDVKLIAEDNGFALLLPKTPVPTFKAEPHPAVLSSPIDRAAVAVDPTR